MSIDEDTWGARLHAAVDDHPAALDFDASSYVAAGRRRVSRNRTRAVVAAAAAVVTVAALAAVVTRDPRAQPAQPVAPVPTAGPARNGWIALEAYEGTPGIHVVRPGEPAHRIEVAGSGATSDACPVWSPDGSRLLFGRAPESGSVTARTADLVVVPVGAEGTAGSPTVIPLAGFDVRGGFDRHPCATWAPDGRWVALAGTGQVWLVDTQGGEIRRLPDLRPSDLEWRPGSDELAIAGDVGTDRAAPTLSSPVTVYSVSSGRTRRLGVAAAEVTWSPDGTTLAYVGGEGTRRQLRLVGRDGTGDRALVADLGAANHGIGPVWSPVGDRIAYQRLLLTSSENHEVVLVDVDGGTETVVAPPTAGGRTWYPYHVSWSPDGTTLLYDAWNLPGPGQQFGHALVTVPVERRQDAQVLVDALDTVSATYAREWIPLQRWGRGTS